MRQKLEYSIPYIVKGKKQFYPVTIEFVMNDVYRKNAELHLIRENVQKKYIRIKEIQQESLNADYKKITELTEELEKHVAYIKQHEDFFKKQFDIINSVLIKNGIENEKINDIQFWDENIEPFEMALFLDAIVNKDMNGLKKESTKK